MQRGAHSGNPTRAKRPRLNVRVDVDERMTEGNEILRILSRDETKRWTKLKKACKHNNGFTKKRMSVTSEPNY